ncbi:actin interacting protein 3-domain-containing protein [Dactylonectria estremocensis]|uniref:Actin interacting protein 3-domain-containing protein n=1 Tax=Dactylonectria estremocensis TaxID=1079267 RepID=A0A9P9JB80_9HYPO|nr:actin interacting protein 3-domain-containing protein [Dactylonectria estremocensis]
MQSTSSQRSYAHRRSPPGDPGPPPNVPIRSISPAIGIQPRSSTASSRSGQSTSSRRMNREGSGSGSNMPLSQIEKSVTHLLVATKQLLETLTQWSRGQATDAQVSDVYVRLGYEFNMACRAFTAINVDTSDLGNVPDLLRHILEATLSQEASAESLEKYLPRIRDIIINLLHGLKRKQQRLRQKQTRDRDGNAAPDRTTSVSTVGSGNSGLTNMLEEGLENGFQPQPESQPAEPAAPAPGIIQSPSRRFNAQRDRSRTSVNSEQSTLSSNTMQSMPVVPPYPESDSTIPTVSSGELNIDSFPPPPPPPPDNTSSALAALQKGGDLERRASRRYSQYQISKHLGGANGVPILPPQTTPVPNRGRREARESLRAVQVRETLRHNRNTSNQSLRSAAVEASPVRIPSSVSEEPPAVAELPTAADSPIAKTPDDKYAASATMNGPPVDPVFINDDPPRDDEARIAQAKLNPDNPPTPPPKPNDASYFQDSPPPTPTKDLTLFLQYKSKVKKFVLPEGRDELSIGRLQLAFIEKFSWNTQQNGADLPEIYIQDPVSGVRHELEDLLDIKDRTVLVLNVEALDEVKRHIDDGIASLTKIVQDVKQTVDDHGAAIQRVSERQLESANEMAKMSLAPAVAPIADGPKSVAAPGRKLDAGHITELQSLRRDLAIVRQTYSKFQADIQDSMSVIRTKAANVKVATTNAAIPDLEGDAGYSYVTNGRKQLNSDSDRLVGKVDDLQDLIEDLRKDVVHRGVRPLPRQLESVAKDVTMLTLELKRMEDYMGQEKPIWTRIWEKELEDVCQGRDEVRLMEDLLVDLRDDLEKASETFTLVEQATKEQMKDNGTGASAGNARQFSKGLNSLGNSTDQSAAKEGVLGEVRALQPNHEDRLEAIERAEKLRQKELETRAGNPIFREMVNVVAEGKLKKSGGFEEVERARKAKDDRIRREVWERQNGIVPDDPIGEDAAEAEDEVNDEPGSPPPAQTDGTASPEPTNGA